MFNSSVTIPTHFDSVSILETKGSGLVPRTHIQTTASCATTVAHWVRSRGLLTLDVEPSRRVRITTERLINDSTFTDRHKQPGEGTEAHKTTIYFVPSLEDEADVEAEPDAAELVADAAAATVLAVDEAKV